jgi:isoquinoline 1-oxidoreductase
MTTDQRKLPGASQTGGGPRPPDQQLASEQDPTVIGDWLTFYADGTVLLRAGKAEVGQDIRTSLAQAVAEELRVPLQSVRTLFGDTAQTPFDMGTFGSRTTPVLAARLHKIAASARELFLARAAERWETRQDDLSVDDGNVMHLSSGRSIAYFDLLDDAEQIDGRLDAPWSEDAPVTPPERWSTAGKAMPRAGGRDFVTGRHRYTTDMVRTGILFGAVLRPPAVGAKLIALDASDAEKIDGVTVVREDSFAGVVAPDRRTARKALAALRAEWDMQEVPHQASGEELYEYLKANPAPPEGYHRWDGPDVFTTGSVEEAGKAGRTHEARYTVPFIAHAPLETRAAVAEWEGERLTVWTGTQRPFGVRTELATAFDMPEELVRVIVPDTGSGYGGKHKGDAAIEAARLARAVGGPVKVVWTREEEFTWAYFRPAGLIEVSSAVAPDGRITAWEYHNYNSGPSAIRPPYAIENQLIAFHTTLSPMRQGSYRALAATANHFARESHIDELAHMAGVDPVEMRLRNIEDERLRAVLLAAAERAGWNTGRATRQQGHGWGIACGTEKGSYVATFAEVAVDQATRAISVVRVIEAFECGAIVNPEGLSNQVEGAIVQALGGALFEKIDFAQGRILSNRFSRYRVPRFSDLPEIEVVLLNRTDLPSAGAGETPIVGLAPAVANAIFDAVGVRLRDLPLELA